MGEGKGLSKLTEFVNYLLSGDTLEKNEPADTGAPENSTGPGISGKKEGFMKWILTPETLDYERPSVGRKGAEDRFVHWLLKSDTLGSSPEKDSSAKTGFLKWLLSTEELASDSSKSSEKPARQGFISWLIGSEKIDDS